MYVKSYQYYQQWLNSRSKPRVSATDISVLMGSNPYKTPAKLLKEKLGQAEREDLSRSSIVQFGNDFEEAIARRVVSEGEYLEDHDLRVPGKWDVQYCRYSEWKVCTCDFFVYDRVAKVSPLEIKTGRKSKWITPPQMYVDQLLWQMHVTDLDVGYLAAFVLPDHEEDRIGMVERDGKEMMGSTSLRDEYFEVLRIAYQSNDPEERAQGIPRLLKAWQEGEIRVFPYRWGDHEGRIRSMVEKAEKFYNKLVEAME